MRNSSTLACLIGLGILSVQPALSAGKSVPACQAHKTPGGNSADVAAALDKLRPLLSKEQRAALERPFDLESAIHWSNLPVGVVPRTTLRLGDLDTRQLEAVHGVVGAALSICGWVMLGQVRAADDQLAPLDTRPIGWSSGNYFLAVLGDPASGKPWMLQLGGHHLAYNFTFNARQPGATPMFLGSEPISFEVRGRKIEPLDAQSTAMSRLAAAIAPRPEAKLSGTFTDIVKGVVVTMRPGQLPSGGIDTGFPHSYPEGDVDRGVRFGALDATQRELVLKAIQAFVELPDMAISERLMAAYQQPEALENSFVGYSGSPDLSTKGSYVRIDGPRLWIEFVVQPAVAKPEELHYHALWRDKLADYGGELRP